MPTDLQIQYNTQLLTADGDANGILTVTSTTGFRKGARVLLKADDIDEAVELIVDKIIDATHLAVRDPTKIGSLRFDASAYTMAENAVLTQNEQYDFYAREHYTF